MPRLPHVPVARSVGRLEVVTGPMFSGKSSELIRRCRRAALFRDVQIFIPAHDTRYGTESIATHDGHRLESIAVATADEILAKIPSTTDVIAIDEAQFFGQALLPVVERLRAMAIDLLVAGLAVTYDGKPFTPIPELMALAERVDKLTALCTVCGNDASFHQLQAAPAHAQDPRVPDASLLGGTNLYQPRCWRHFDPGSKAR